MHKKFEMNLTKIKGGYQPGIKVVTHNSKSDLPLSGNIVYQCLLGTTSPLVERRTFLQGGKNCSFPNMSNQ